MRGVSAIGRRISPRPIRERPCIVVLTGTDLYRDIAIDASAQRRCSWRDRLVVLQPQGLETLPPALRRKTAVIYQSARRLAPLAAADAAACDVICVAHLRDEKDPPTLLRAARAAAPIAHDIRITLIGDALDPALGDAVRDACAERRRCAGSAGCRTPPTRQHIQRSQLLVNTSRMEGGAHVILEAAQSGSRGGRLAHLGNVGMLGPTTRGCSNSAMMRSLRA